MVHQLRKHMLVARVDGAFCRNGWPAATRAKLGHALACCPGFCLPTDLFFRHPLKSVPESQPLPAFAHSGRIRWLRFTQLCGLQLHLR